MKTNLPLLFFAPIFFLFLSCTATATEADHVKAHCKGEMEYALPDRTHVDCLTKAVAWEYDFARKWAESIGQALHYSRMTGKEPGVVLIIETPSNCAHVEKVRAIKVAFVENLHIDVIGKCPKR